MDHVGDDADGHLIGEQRERVGKRARGQRNAHTAPWPSPPMENAYQVARRISTRATGTDAEESRPIPRGKNERKKGHDPDSQAERSGRGIVYLGVARRRRRSRRVRACAEHRRDWGTYEARAPEQVPVTGPVSL